MDYVMLRKKKLIENMRKADIIGWYQSYNSRKEYEIKRIGRIFHLNIPSDNGSLSLKAGEINVKRCETFLLLWEFFSYLVCLLFVSKFNLDMLKWGAMDFRPLSIYFPPLGNIQLRRGSSFCIWYGTLCTCSFDLLRAISPSSWKTHFFSLSLRRPL